MADSFNKHLNGPAIILLILVQPSKVRKTSQKRGQRSKIVGGKVLLTLASILSVFLTAHAQQLPDWTAKIRKDHPRLFFNADTFPAVHERALGAERKWYKQSKKGVDKLMAELADQVKPEPRELGPQAAQAAFVHLITRDIRYLELAKKCLDTSLRFYEECYRQRKSVNWYSTTRVHAVMAWDWLYNDFTESERHDYLSRLIKVINNVIEARPRIHREHLSRHSTGFYGVRNCLWFIGSTGSRPGPVYPANTT